MPRPARSTARPTAKPEFYQYYKSLEGYRSAFSKPSDVLLVDPSSEFFQFLKHPQGQAAPAK